MATAARARARTATRARARTATPPEPALDIPVAKAKKPDSASDARRYLDAALLIRHASDGTRLKILASLAVGEMNVGEMCKALGLTQPGVSHHLCLMRTSNIVAQERSGQNIIYSLSDKGRLLFDAVRCLIEV